MKKHPGIWFSLWAGITIFLLSFELAMLNVNDAVFRIIIFFWSGECMIWIIHFHCNWLEAIDRKYYLKENQKEKEARG
jgi:hypothetical protein